jgi:site-specific DNA recombinase
MEKYCAYLRKSRADLELEARGEMETLARHRKALLELSERLKLPISQFYEEIVSGETISARPVVQKLIGEVGRGLWRGVFVMEIERLARGDTFDQGKIARAFSLGHAKIITPGKIYDPDNEFDEEYFEFGLFMSRREYKTINRRIQRGRVASVKDGKFIGSVPPFGYDKVRLRGDKGYTLSPNADATAVKMIFEMYAAGRRVSEILRRLADAGIKPPRKPEWSKSTLYGILSNPVYAGKIRWAFRKSSKTMESGGVKSKRVKSDAPIVSDGLHEVIIGEDLFEKVSRLRKTNAVPRIKRGFALQNPLSGLIYCRRCGARMTRLGPCARRGQAYLSCPNRACRNVSAPLSLVEEKLLAALADWLSGYRLDFSAVPDTSGEYAAILKALDAARRERELLDTQLGSAHDLLEQGIYTPAVFAARRAELNERAQKTEERIARLSDDLKRFSRPRAFSAAETLLGGYESLTVGGKNRLLRLLVCRVEYEKYSANEKGGLGNPSFELSVYPKLPRVG